MTVSWILLVEFLGAALVLLAYWANASGRWSREARRYLYVNLLGAMLLGIAAVITRRWGFVLLEVVWASISLAGLMHRRS